MKVEIEQPNRHEPQGTSLIPQIGRVGPMSGDFMHSESRSSVAKDRSLLLKLAPLAGVMFVAFFVAGMAMPVLSLHIHQRLRFGALVVGFVAGSQFSVALLSRLWAGHQTDTHGSKWAITVGLLVSAAAGLVYLLSLRFIQIPVLSVSLLLVGRGMLGGAESLIVTGIMTWGLALGASAEAGKILAWLGTPMFAAFALGAPVGSILYAAYGFSAVALATAASPLLVLLLIAWRRAPPPPSARRASSFFGVAGRVIVPGLGMALGSVGFGAVTTFITLLFAARGWGSAWITFSALCVCYMLPRLVLGHLPDRIGGARVALLCIVVEAAGQLLIWLAPSPSLAFTGAALTGLGYSMVFPAFAVEAVRAVGSDRRGLALGAYTACLDLALGVSGPLLGLVADRAQIGTVFLVSAIVCSGSAGVAIYLEGRGAGSQRLVKL